MEFDFQLKGKKYEESYTSVDGTDFTINEPTPFSTSLYSHKFRGHGLRYQVRVSIDSAKIVRAKSPWPCGTYSDLRVFRE